MRLTADRIAPLGATTEEHRRNGRDPADVQGNPSWGPRALCGWSPEPLPADTALKRRVDRVLVGNLPAIVMVATVVALLNLVPHIPLRAGLAIDGLAALIGGGWCSLNFWRCRHAHCLVTGVGWLALSLFVFVEAGIGHSSMGGDEQPLFLAVLAAALIFEFAWYLARHTQAIGPARQTLPNVHGKGC
ncbi:MAG: hypothetical protein ACREPI_00115 [Candidatus Dormibacterales bacterium]